MSYILEALRKADRERELGEVPDLEAAHWGVRQPERSRRWLWIVAALLGFNAILLVYMLNRSPQIQEQASVEAPQQSRPVPAGIPAVPAIKSHQQRREEAVTEAEPIVKRAKVAVRPHVAVTTPPSVNKPAATGSPRVVTAATPMQADSSPVASGLPEWSELPLEFRSRFQLPHVDVHVYADEPKRRFILVDLKKYREGDTLDSGAVLEKIEQGYIQLFFQGTRFRVDR